MERILNAELLDDDLGTSEEVQQSLDDLWRINSWLGGVHSNLHLLKCVFGQTGADCLRVLDVGAGDARLAKSLRQALSRQKQNTEFEALDRRQSRLRNGRSEAEGLLRVAADVFELPFAENSFDVALCNLFFHHFSGERARLLLQRLASVASRAVIINDLERNALHYFFIRVLIPSRAAGLRSMTDRQVCARRTRGKSSICWRCKRAFAISPSSPSCRSGWA